MRSTAVTISARVHVVNALRCLQPTRQLDCQPGTGQPIVTAGQKGDPVDAPRWCICGGKPYDVAVARQHDLPGVDLVRGPLRGRRSGSAAGRSISSVGDCFLTPLQDGGPGQEQTMERGRFAVSGCIDGGSG